jgi:hypothetical protein
MGPFDFRCRKPSNPDVVSPERLSDASSRTLRTHPNSQPFQPRGVTRLEVGVRGLRGNPWLEFAVGSGGHRWLRSPGLEFEKRNLEKTLTPPQPHKGG